MLPSVRIELDKVRHLRFDATAFARLKERGYRLAALTAQEMDIAVTRDLLWAGLLHEDPVLSPDEVGHWFTLRDLDRLAPALAEALRLAMPERPPAGAEASEEANPPTPSLATTTGPQPPSA